MGTEFCKQHESNDTAKKLADLDQKLGLTLTVSEFSSFTKKVRKIDSLEAHETQITSDELPKSEKSQKDS